MGIYRDRVLPRLQDKVMDRPDSRDIRARVCAGLSGEVVEIGFGTGLNMPHYPADVTRIAAVEPSALCVRLAQSRIAESTTEVSLVGLSGESLALPSAAYEAAVSTWTLCTIPDVEAALAEVRRVLRPGGRFHFVEHGHAPDPAVARWQRRIEPVWKRVAGGCHVSRPIGELIERAGFRMEALDTYYQDGEPRVFGYTFEGVATKS
ncbi:MAG TPA: methyltransferase domain-containing protein [Jatrophihabitantaceae bacterium]|nr:methyltransferase domain-containing protein [Jatrophihabitantaceae bacterium]